MTQLNRRDFLKLGGLTLLGLAGGSNPVSGAFAEREVIPQPVYPDEEIQEKNLREAGLGDYIDLYNTEREFAGKWGYALFPEISGTLAKVGIGARSEAPGAGILSKEDSGHLNRDKLIDEAESISRSIDINAGGDYPKAREVFRRLADSLPGLWLNAPQRINFDNEGHIDYSPEEIRIDDPPDFDNHSIESYYHALIHELSHAIDWSRFNLKALDRLHEYIPKKTLINYMRTYTEAVDNVLESWVDMDLNDALSNKGGSPLLSIHGLPDAAETWRNMAFDLSERMGLDEAELKGRLTNYSSQNSLDIKDDDPTYLFNISAHEFLNSLKEARQSDPVLFERMLNVPEIQAYRNVIIDEVAHYLVGPAYGSGRLIVGSKNQFNTLTLESARLEAARLAMLTPDGKTIDVTSLRNKLYAELESGLISNLENEEAPWQEFQSFLKAGAEFKGKVIIKDADDKNQDVIAELRAYELPQSYDLPDKRLIALILKYYNPVTDPFGGEPSWHSGDLLLLPSEKKSAVIYDSQDYKLAFSKDLQLVARSQKADKEGIDILGSDFYYGGEKIPSLVIWQLGLELAYSRDNFIYNIPVEVLKPDGTIELKTTPSVVVGAIGGYGSSVIPLPPEDKVEEFDPKKTLIVAHAQQLKTVNGLGRPFTVRAESVITTPSNGINSYIVEDGNLSLRIISAGSTKNIYNIEATLSPEDTEKILGSGFEEAMGWDGVRGGIDLNSRYEPVKSNGTYKGNDIYEPPYNIWISIYNEDNSRVLYNVKPQTVSIKVSKQ